MILDDSAITLRDGGHRKAIDVYPGREVFSMKSGKPGRATVHGKNVEFRESVVKLLLSSGNCLIGSWDQPVAVAHPKSLRYTPMNEVGIGDKLRGERAGLLTTVEVIGRSLPAGEARLVSFNTGGYGYVAEGILCR